jgi:hypothetical protein
MWSANISCRINSHLAALPGPLWAYGARSNPTEKGAWQMGRWEKDTTAPSTTLIFYNFTIHIVPHTMGRAIWMWRVDCLAHKVHQNWWRNLIQVNLENWICSKQRINVMADLDEPNGNPTMDGICFNLPSWRAFHMFHLSSYQTNGLFTADWLVRSTLVVPKYLAYELHQLVCYIFNQAYWAKLAPLHPGSGAAGCIGALMVSIWSRWWPGTSGVHHGLPWPNMAHHGPPSTTLQPWGPLQRSLMVIDFGKGFDPEQKHCTGCSSKC